MNRAIDFSPPLRSKNLHQLAGEKNYTDWILKSFSKKIAKNFQLIQNVTNNWTKFNGSLIPSRDFG